MDWNVEIRVSQIEIDDLGRATAIARATRRAWLRVVMDAHPKHSLMLPLPPEERADSLFGGAFDYPDLILRFRFEVS